MNSIDGNASVTSGGQRQVLRDPPSTPAVADLGLPSLPAPLTSFIGREELTTGIAGILRRRETRLLTLTGPGGVGKTRLALKVAETLLPDVTDGVGFIALTTVRDPAQVLPAIARGLGIREGNRRSLIGRIGSRLEGRWCLLVLDNFEQVVTAGPMLTELLGACPDLTLLVTSRALLRVSGEHAYPVPPLALPAPGTGAEVVDAEAVRLFVARAEAVNPGVTLTETSTPAIAEICARLDGLPLAIELAAARSSLFAPPAMLARLEQRLPMLTGGPHDQPARLQTMTDAIRWSYELLADDEQVLFRCLSVFIGGFALPAMAAISDEREAVAIARLETLVDHSLVRSVTGSTDEPRYTMLETIREFGLDQLRVAGEEDGARKRHAAFFLALAEHIDLKVDGPEANIWLPRLDLDRPNLHAALAWLIEHNEAEGALRLAAALWRYWRIRGYLSEGRDALSRALALPGIIPPSVRADALRKLGCNLFYLGEYDSARNHLDQSVAQFNAAGDLAGEANALDSLGTVFLLQHDLQEAHHCLERAIAVRRELGEVVDVGVTLANLSMLALNRGELIEARALLHESLAIARESDSRRDIAFRSLNLSRVEVAEGHLDAARELAEESLRFFEEIGDQLAIASALEVLGQVVGELGEHSRGVGFLMRSLRLRLKSNLYRDLGGFVEQLATTAVALDPLLATRLLAAGATDREATGVARPEMDAATWDRAVATARDALGAKRFDEAWRHGARMSLQVAIREAEAAFGELAPPDAATPPIPPTGDPKELATIGLSPRELDVLRLVAAGHSNREIAGALYISTATAKRHVTNILTKLELSSRAAAITYALRAGLLDT